MRRASLVLLVAGVAAAPLAAQYQLTAPSGEVIEFTPEELLSFRDRTDSLMTDLQEDPVVIYAPVFGRSLDETQGRDAWPWNAVDVVTDSLASVVMPGNLREAGRAYQSYVVLRMHAARQDPDVACSAWVDREMFALDGFVDGWVASRTLFGGPAYEPLDELAHARSAGVLKGLMLDRSNRQLGGCLENARRDGQADIDAYHAWRTDHYQGGE